MPGRGNEAEGEYKGRGLKMRATVVCPNCGCAFELSREDVAKLRVHCLAKVVYSKDIHAYHELLREADVEHYELRCACSCGRCDCTIFFVDKSRLNHMVAP